MGISIGRIQFDPLMKGKILDAVETYKRRRVHYPEVLWQINYRTQENRRKWCEFGFD